MKKIFSHICCIVIIRGNSVIPAGGDRLKYVATPVNPGEKIQLNNHKDSSNTGNQEENGAKKETGPSKMSNGEPIVRKKTLREMLAGVPGFSNKVFYNKNVC